MSIVAEHWGKHLFVCVCVPPHHDKGPSDPLT
jgi:hypothetical protein